MKSTDFLKLNMPELSDKADITKVSEDMDWIDSAIKSLNEFHASVEQRLTRLELKGETTDTAIANIRTDVSSLIRNVDGLISRVNSLETSQTATASRINILSERVDSELAALTSKVNNLETRLNGFVETYSEDMSIVNEKIDRIDGYFKPVAID